jgi:hypothetical protein
MTGSKAALWLLCLTSLAGCSPDYGAVRSWSDQARVFVEPPLAEAGAPRGESAAARGRRDALAALNGAASAWLSALAMLAEDGRIAERANPLTAEAGRVEAFDGEGAAAVLALGEVMADGARRNWRAPDLTTAVERGDPPFQSVILALVRQAEALAAERPDPRVELLARYGPWLAERPGRSLRGAIEELQALRWQELERRARSEAAWRKGIDRLSEGHALLMTRRARLSQAETARLLRAQETELRRLVLLIEGR